MLSQQLESNDQPIRFNYHIDRQDRLTDVDDAWEWFARENAATKLTRSTVRGTSIWKFISGYEVRHLYEMLFAAVRKYQRPVTIPFRCDSPSLRRYMELRIEPDNGGNLSLTGSILFEELRKPVLLVGNGARDPSRMLPICSWCKRVDIGDDQWVAVEDAVRELKLFNVEMLPALSHSICLDCITIVETEIDNV